MNIIYCLFGFCTFVGFIYYFNKHENKHDKFITDNNYVSKIDIMSIYINNKIVDDYYLTMYINYILSKYIANDEILDNFYDIKTKITTNINRTIVVEYSFNNNNYKIAINNLNNFKINDNKIIEQKFVIGQLSKNYVKDITNKLRMFAGPNNNFYNDLEGVSTIISDLLFDEKLDKEDTVIVYDFYGKKYIFNISDKFSIIN